MQNDVLPVFLGATEGAYALCRAFYYDYGIRSLVIDERIPPLFENTKVAAACAFPHLTVPTIFERVLEDVHEKGRGKSLLLIPADACYLSLASAKKEHLEKMFLMPHLPTPSLQKKGECVPTALALLYCSGENETRVLYAKTCAVTENGEIVGVIAAPVPPVVEQRILSLPDARGRGCYLFYLTENGENVECAREASPLHPLMAFATASDASLPEWMITETVLAEPIPPKDESVCGVFTLFSFRKTKRYLRGEYKKQAKTLCHRRLATALYVTKGEAKSAGLSRVFRTLYRLYTEKTEKIKK